MIQSHIKYCKLLPKHFMRIINYCNVKMFRVLDKIVMENIGTLSFIQRKWE